MRARAVRSILSAVLAVASPLCALGAVAACSTGAGSDAPDASTSCANVSTSCPATPPSWKNDVQPIIATYCLACHGEGGIEQPLFDYTTYQGVYAHRATMLTQVYQCLMPPPDASPPPVLPSATDRETLVAWLACGAPDN